MYFERDSLVKLLAGLILLLLHVMPIYSDEEKSFSTSISGLVQLLEMEMQLIASVEKYAAKMQNKVNILKNLVEELNKKNLQFINNPEEYFSNPLNGFSLIRHLQNDWPQIELFITEPVDQIDLDAIQKYRPLMPTNKDLEEASEAIYRLQTVYDLNAEDIANGILNGKPYDAKLKSIDTYYMGYYLFSKKNFYSAGFWLNSSITNYEENSVFNNAVGYGKEKPLELYAVTLVEQNRPQYGLQFISQALDLRPNDTRLLSRKNQIEQLANINTDLVTTYPTPAVNNYERGCRGEFANRTSKLFCIFNTTTTPFLRLAPLKMEILNLEPYIFLFHDIISDQEIEHLKKLARPNLKRATVYNSVESRSVVVNARTSKFSWFEDNTDEITRRINRRVIDMTGFDIQGSEMLQVMNYGLGGHYEAHYDFFNSTPDAPVIALDGDRMATVLFYLTDVEEGGATIFPNIWTAVYPRKGTAVIWYNLNNKIEGDILTLHAACPVIVGSKWVTTKWIHSNAQTFRKPCFT